MVNPSREDLARLNRAGLDVETVYKCQKCGQRYSQDMEREALLHAAIPLSHEPLPRGVVYRFRNLELGITGLEITDAPQIYEQDHTVMAVNRNIDDLTTSTASTKANFGSWEMDDTILRFQHKSGTKVTHSLLSREEFYALITAKPTIREDVMRLWGIPQVLRTHPAIEAIIREGSRVF
jgi:hypothetical protein